MLTVILAIIGALYCIKIIIGIYICIRDLLYTKKCRPDVYTNWKSVEWQGRVFIIIDKMVTWPTRYLDRFLSF